jgi:hypothetical protein
MDLCLIYSGIQWVVFFRLQILTGSHPISILWLSALYKPGFGMNFGSTDMTVFWELCLRVVEPFESPAVGNFVLMTRLAEEFVQLFVAQASGLLFRASRPKPVQGERRRSTQQSPSFHHRSCQRNPARRRIRRALRPFHPSFECWMFDIEIHFCGYHQTQSP